MGTAAGQDVEPALALGLPMDRGRRAGYPLAALGASDVSAVSPLS